MDQPSTGKRYGQMSSGDYRRRSLFDRFSKNLYLTKQYMKKRFPVIAFEPDLDEGYVCPICFGLFSVEALSDYYANPLQLEDVPPRKLGGKPLLLTCKSCNNTAGSKLESPLKLKLHNDEFADAQPDSGIDVRLRTEDSIDLAATMYHSGKKDFKLVLHPDQKRSHPEHVKKWRDILATGNIPTFNLEIREIYQPLLPEVALLRIGLLLAFSMLGYEFLFLTDLKLIRQQIEEPTTKLLTALGTISNLNISDMALGVNVVFEPREMQSLLVVFDLATSNRKTRHGVILPGPIEPALDLYSWLANKKMQSLAIKANPVPPLDYLENPELDYLSIWNYLRVNHEISDSL